MRYTVSMRIQSGAQKVVLRVAMATAGFAALIGGLRFSNNPGQSQGFALVSVAMAAEDEAEGKRRFVRGQELYEAGRFSEAAEEFEAGYTAAPRPAFLLNIARSYRKAGALDKAKTYFDLLLTVAPDLGNREDVQADIQEVDAELAAQNEMSPAASDPTSYDTADLDTVPQAEGDYEFSRPTVMTLKDGQEDEKDSRSILASPWFWVATVAVVVGAGLVTAMLIKNNDPGCTYTACFRETP